MKGGDPDAATIGEIAAALVATSRRLRLYCGRCWAEARHDYGLRACFEATVREEAARQFIGQGWRIDRVPLCPKCAKARGHRG